MGNKITATLISVLLWGSLAFAQQNGQQMYTRGEVRELSLAYQEVIRTLEAQMREHDSIIRSLQVQLAANRDYQKALEENNEVLRELAGGKKKTKMGWLWFGVTTAGTIFSACEATSIC